MEEYVDVNEGKVTVCRDFAKGKCNRHACKYYHVPVTPGSMLLNRLLTSPAPTPLIAAPLVDQTAFLLAQQPLFAVPSSNA